MIRSAKSTRTWARAIAALLLIGAMASLAGCAWLWPPTEWTGDVASSSLDRETKPAASMSSVDTLVAGNTAFAFDLLHELASDAGNLIVSPFSISTALAMTYAGAEGNTQAEMAETLHFDLQPATLHSGFNFLDLELGRCGTIELPYEGEGFDLDVVNATWGQLGYAFRDTYLDILALHYGAGLRLLDFEENPDGSRQTINEWVSKETHDKIADLLPPNSIDAATRLVLTNAVYFNAPWLFPFDPEQTRTGTFYPLAGSAVPVSMMQQESSVNYATWTGGQAIELPYNGNTLSMVLLVPDQGTFEDFEAGLDAAQYESILPAFESRTVTLKLPRFEANYEGSLVDPLVALGMTDAFIGGVADFSGIDGTHDLCISDVVHKAWISVDEAGTEAAAATAVIMPLGGAGELVILTVDRPFLFVIRDIPTDTILFLGRVVDIVDLP